MNYCKNVKLKSSIKEIIDNSKFYSFYRAFELSVNVRNIT